MERRQLDRVRGRRAVQRPRGGKALCSQAIGDRLPVVTLRSVEDLVRHHDVLGHGSDVILLDDVEPRAFEQNGIDDEVDQDDGHQDCEETPPQADAPQPAQSRLTWAAKM